MPVTRRPRRAAPPVHRHDARPESYARLVEQRRHELRDGPAAHLRLRHLGGRRPADPGQLGDPDGLEQCQHGDPAELVVGGLRDGCRPGAGDHLGERQHGLRHRLDRGRWHWILSRPVPLGQRRLARIAQCLRPLEGDRRLGRCHHRAPDRLGRPLHDGPDQSGVNATGHRNERLRLHGEPLVRTGAAPGPRPGDGGGRHLGLRDRQAERHPGGLRRRVREGDDWHVRPAHHPGDGDAADDEPDRNGHLRNGQPQPDRQPQLGRGVPGGYPEWRRQ